MGKVVSALPGPVNTRRLANTLAPRNVEEALFGPEAMDAAIPSANGFFTARSLARMYAMIAGGGELDGTRLLSPERIRIISEVQRQGRDHVLVMPMDWRLGYHRVFTTRGPVRTAFGHFGFGGSGAWADPERDLAIGFVCNRGSGTPVGDLRIMELGTAAVKAADRMADRGGRFLTIETRADTECRPGSWVWQFARGFAEHPHRALHHRDARSSSAGSCHRDDDHHPRMDVRHATGPWVASRMAGRRTTPWAATLFATMAAAVLVPGHHGRGGIAIPAARRAARCNGRHRVGPAGPDRPGWPRTFWSSSSCRVRCNTSGARSRACRRCRHWSLSWH